MAPELTADNLPLGDLRFYDNYVPALAAGDWKITVKHTLGDIPTGDLGATQRVVVSAPQFAMDSTAILNRQPPAASTGQYGKVLPHIVLNDALLPWERTLKADSGRPPWLALLVLTDDEITGGTTSPTRTQTTTVGAFRAPDPAVLKPAVTPEGDVNDTDPCAFVQIPATHFPQIVPRLEELRFLAHCRQSHIADKAEQGLETNGLFSAVVANRFPATPTGDHPGARKSIVHLVSLEGLEPWLIDKPNFGGHTSVALVSLASWTFETTADPRHDFRALMKNLVRQEYDGTTYTPGNLWLRLPRPASATAASTPAAKEAERRLNEGFVPLTYRLRTGEQTLAWYRGPCAPVRTPSPPMFGRTPFATADAALVYHSAFGVFDASLATAWQTGRSLALADRAFGQALHDFRRRAHQLTDRLLQQLHSPSFTADRITELTVDQRIQDAFLSQLTTSRLTAMTTPVAPRPPDDTATPTGTVRQPAAPPPDPVAAIDAFLAAPEAQQLIGTETKDHLTPVADWLARLQLLYPVPFRLLVPDQRMLARETLRFFHLDDNWIRALTDGALSIGVHSARDTRLSRTIGGVIQVATQRAAQALRAQRTGIDQPTPAPVTGNQVSGLLLRSAAVSGWPNLAVRATLKGQSGHLPVLRMDRLDDDTLLCLFQGTPDEVELAEPQEGFRFGVDDDDQLPMRRPTAQPGSPLGTQLATSLPLLPDSLRPGGLRVLDVTAAVRRVRESLTAAGSPVPDFGPADFALQMVKAPEAIQFTSQAS
ncbi:hypothetical protein ACIQNG_18700 [Streptomyces sp. NPDC091377]|uniref:hypothetical protein n=1 Tax=Streptomyces sp. NPDC091377 TaxID=3365995 RepID=UPI0037F74E9B